MLKSNVFCVCLGSILLLCFLCNRPSIAEQTPHAAGSLPSRIHIGDVLQVSVYKHPELSRRITVDGDANHVLAIDGEKNPMPSAIDGVLSEMEVAGLTLADMATAVREKLKPMIATPQVTITVIETIMKPLPPSDKASPQLRDTPAPVQKQCRGVGRHLSNNLDNSSLCLD